MDLVAAVAMTQVELTDVARVHELEKQVEALAPGQGLPAELVRRLRVTPNSSLKLSQTVVAFKRLTAQRTMALVQAMAGETSMTSLLLRLRGHVVAQAGVSAGQPDQAALCLFGPMPASKSGMLMGLISKIEALRRPLIGMLFRGGQLAQLDLEISQTLPCPNPVGLSRKPEDLKAVVRTLGAIKTQANDLGLLDESTAAVYVLLAGTEPTLEAAGAGFKVLRALQPVVEAVPAMPIWQCSDIAPSAGSMLEQALLMAEYMVIHDRLSQNFASVPAVGFLREKGRLEALNTSRLAYKLDSCFLKFAEENRATAALGGVIKQRAQFPTDQFKTLRDAFPCVIVRHPGVRRVRAPQDRRLRLAHHRRGLAGVSRPGHAGDAARQAGCRVRRQAPVQQREEPQRLERH